MPLRRLSIPLFHRLRVSAVLGCYPNPFNPATTIRVRLVGGSGATLRIVDVSGRVVRTLDLSGLGAGEHRIDWDGNGDGGLRLSSGVYLARLEAADGAHAVRMVLLR